MFHQLKNNIQIQIKNHLSSISFWSQKEKGPKDFFFSKWAQKSLVFLIQQASSSTVFNCATDMYLSVLIGQWQLHKLHNSFLL